MTCRRALLLAGLAAGCAPRVRDGLGVVPGRVAGGDGVEGGIGGTGIFGLLTAAPEPRVAGIPLLAAPDAAAALPGDTVIAEGARSRDGLRSTRLAAFVPLAGTLQVALGGGYAVLDTPLLPNEALVLRDASGTALPAGAIRPGEAVAVSGIWNGRAVLPTSLRRLAAPPEPVLRGQLREQDGRLVVGGTRLDFGSLPPPPLDSFVVLRGRQTPGAFRVTALQTPPRAVFDPGLSALAVEGVLAPNTGAPGFHLSGFGLPLDPASPVAPRPGQRQLLLGRYGEAFLAREAVRLPTDPLERARVLASDVAEAAIRRWLVTA